MFVLLKHKYSALLIIVFLLYSMTSISAVVSGRVTNEKGEPLPFVNIYVKNTVYGVASNSHGDYFLELKAGTYILTFSLLGYQQFEQEIKINKGEHLTINIVLSEISKSFKEVEIVAKNVDKSREIMRKVRDKRRFFLDQIENYSCNTYLKTSLEKEITGKDQSDSIGNKEGNLLDLNTHFKNEKINLIETYSQTNYKAPSSYKEIVSAFHDYAEGRKPIGRNVTMGVEIGPPDIAPKATLNRNPYLIYDDINSCDFNFYDNQFSFPAICQKPLLSPLASTAPLNYTYKFKRSFVEDGKTINEIEVIPLFKKEALFSGTIYVEDSSWAVITFDLFINKGALLFCRDFHIIQNYREIEKNKLLPVRRELIYSIKEGNNLLLGNTRIDHSDYVINKSFPAKFFNDELITYTDDAFNKDTAFWKKQRPITLQDNEIVFIHKSDSIWRYYESEAYDRKVDSAFNHVRWISLLAGVGHRNHKKGTEFYLEGLLGQVNPFGIGGYRHKLPGHFKKEFDNHYLLETDGFIDYGFKNEDVKGKLGVGLTYVPLKFVRTYIRAGYFYDMINNYASLEQVFSGSNFIRTTSYLISQRMEVVNGLFGEFTIEYSDQEPLTDIQLSRWSEYVFGSLNNPDSFTRYKKTEIKLELKYRFRQKYFIRNGKKIIVGSKYPELTFVYRKGIPGIFGSEVNFDYLELGAKDDLNLGRLGNSRWQVLAGTFLNKPNLRVLEYKYFRGSDHFIFSDPLQSFQLLGLMVSTPEEYLRINYMHHFQGTLLSKLPLINLLKIDLAAGAGTLMIPDENLYHFEMFIGLERVVRIRKQLWRFGVYAVTAENSVSAADYTLKLGISYFNSFTNKWNY